MNPDIAQKCMRFEELASRRDLSDAEWKEACALAVWIGEHRDDFRAFKRACGEASRAPLQ